MSNAELVNALERDLKSYAVRLPLGTCLNIKTAITALSAQDDVRDSVLTEVAAAIRKALVGNPAHDEARVIAERVISNSRALKSKPAAPVVEDKPELVPGIRKAIQWLEDNPTPQAQEAPQSLEDAFKERHGLSLDRWAGIKDLGTRCAFVWLLRELDRRKVGK